MRIYVALFTEPYAVLWTRSPDAGGVLLPLTHTALVWFYVFSLDEAFIKAGLDPRLSVTPDRHDMAEAPVRVFRMCSGVAAGLLTLFLLVSGEPRLALLAAAGGAGVALLVRTAIGPDGQRRFLFAEVVWAGVMLMGPCLLVGAPGWSASNGELGELAPEPMSMAVVAATGLGSLMLGVWALLCMRRDAAADAAVGLRTTATLLGPQGSLALTALWVVGAVAVSAWGVAEGWWGWIVAALVAWAAVAVTWALARGAERGATLLWTVATALVAVVVSAQVWQGEG